MIEQKYNFFAFTPKENVNLDIYKNALDFIFTNNKMLDIAISGAYGSGKSSVLASYKNLRKNKSFLHISLAHFHAVDEKDNDKLKITTDMLEGKIINQLLHQIPPNKIPNTNFRVKNAHSTKKMICTALLAVLSITVSLYILFAKQWTEFVYSLTVTGFKTIIMVTTYSGTRLAAGAILFVLAVYYLTKIQENYSLIKKAGMGCLEVEIFEDKKESYFDKYLNEVLYLFDKSDMDVIVFEDIDRYDSSIIFERLREINTLVNNLRARKKSKLFCLLETIANCQRLSWLKEYSEPCLAFFDPKSKPLRFFYLMRDDIFKSKDKTKFFDFIIPIVPVIDGSNSFDKFIDCFNKSGLSEVGIGHEFLQGLSLYIDDMRTLQNICNEFIIYNSLLSTTELNPNKMLAIITYKNLFPRDFADLQLGQGFMFYVIGGNGKEHLIKAEKERLQKLIEDKGSELKAIKNEMLTSDEIAIVYYAKIMATLNDSSYISHLLDHQLCIQKINSNRSTNNSDVKNIIAEYDKRFKWCSESENAKSVRIQTLELEISKAKLEKEELLDQRLVDIITSENIDELFKTNETEKPKEFPLLKASPYFAILKYFVREGYIDETYADYMTYFYENSLTRIDKIFLKSVTDRQAKEASYKLINPTMVPSSLPISSFGQVEILNYDLFTFLIADYAAYGEFKAQAQKFIGQLKSNKNCTFMLDYCQSERDLMNIVKIFGTEWTSFIYDLLVTKTNSGSPSVPATISDIFIKKYAYALLAIIGEDCKNIQYLDDNSRIEIVKYISNDPNFLVIDNCEDNLVANGINQLEILFLRINPENAKASLMEQIYHNNSYVINIDNITAMLKTYYSNVDAYDIYSANYTVIMTDKQSPLAVYINDNINDYMDAIFENCPAHIADSPVHIVSLLNNTNIDIAKKIEYISYLKTNIVDLSDIDDKSLWTELLKNKNVIECSSTNIVSYFVEICNDQIFNDILVEYLNVKGTDLTFDLLTDFDDTAVKNRFITALIEAKDLNNLLYEKYLQQLNQLFPEFATTDLPQDKLAILDKLGKIKMDANLLHFMRENYKGYLCSFIKNNIESYIVVIADPQNFRYEEMIELLDSDISDSHKIATMKCDGDKPISIKGKQYSDAVYEYILKNKYDEADLNYLLEKYSSFDEHAQSAILDIAEDAISGSLAMAGAIDRKLLLDIFSSEKIKLEDKRSLFKAEAPSANDDEIQQWLPLIKNVQFLNLYKTVRPPTFENNEWNKSLLEIFEKRGLIADYSINTKGKMCIKRKAATERT